MPRKPAGTAKPALVNHSRVADGGQEATAPAAPGGKTMAIVQPGETLWDIAERHAPEGMDPRVYVEALTEVNELDSVLQAGTRLRLP